MMLETPERREDKQIKLQNSDSMCSSPQEFSPGKMPMGQGRTLTSVDNSLQPDPHPCPHPQYQWGLGAYCQSLFSLQCSWV